MDRSLTVFSIHSNSNATLQWGLSSISSIWRWRTSEPITASSVSSESPGTRADTISTALFDPASVCFSSPVSGNYHTIHREYFHASSSPGRESVHARTIGFPSGARTPPFGTANMAGSARWKFHKPLAWSPGTANSAWERSVDTTMPSRKLLPPGSPKTAPVSRSTTHTRVASERANNTSVFSWSSPTLRRHQDHPSSR